MKSVGAGTGVHAGPAAILLISHSGDHRATLTRALLHSGRRICEARNYREALAALCRERMSVVICERHLPDGDWKDVLGLIAPLPEAPCLIVTDATAEDGFWAEVLNLGGYDVLMQPLLNEEVTRVVELACEQWEREYRAAATRKPARQELAGERRASKASSGR
ncbi:MAG: two-component system response regulator [bacterium]